MNHLLRPLMLLILGLSNMACQWLDKQSNQDPIAINTPLPDQVTTEVVVNLRKPVVFYRNDLALSSVARDYLYIGPVQTDNSGVRELSLWVGLASTIDRHFVREEFPVGDELVLTLDSTTLRLPLIPWIHDTEHSPFPTPTTLTQALRAPVTQQQIQQIAEATEVSIDLIFPSNRAYHFQHWQGQWLAWEEIEQDTQVGFSVRVQQSGAGQRLD